MAYKRIFLIVLDSLGIGEARDAKKYGDEGSNTLLSVLKAKENPKLENLKKLGLLNLCTDSKYHSDKFLGVICKLNELSKGKDTLTGHYEMMGLEVKKPSKTFTEKGFPKELIKVLEDKWGRKIIGNKSASGTVIIDELGKEHLETGNVIVYTSADSVLQIAAHEEVVPLEELYKMCEIAREVTLKDKWKVDRIIARPFIGSEKDGFKRTSNRQDYAISPFKKTYLTNLKEENLDVIAIGKINDIFNGQGITRFMKTSSNLDGMNKTIDVAKNDDFKGLCFVNLVEFDSEYGHRRNPLGYLTSLEEFDLKLKELLDNLQEDDLLMLTADHGNDPSFKGTDHTREKVPLVMYAKHMKSGKLIDEMNNFACIGATIMDNFKLKRKRHQIGISLLSKIRKEVVYE